MIKSYYEKVMHWLIYEIIKESCCKGGEIGEKIGKSGGTQQMSSN